MKISSKPYYARQKTPELRQRVAAAVSNLEDRGELGKARELVMTSLLLDSASGRDLDSMKRRASLKMGVKKFIPEAHLQKLVLGGATVGAAAAGIAANLNGAGVLWTAIAAAAGGVGGGLATLVTGAHLLENVAEIGEVEMAAVQELQQAVETVSARPETELHEPDLTVTELHLSGQQHQTPYHQRQRRLLSQDLAWFQDQGLADQPVARVRQRLQQRQNRIMGLASLAQNSKPIALSVGAAAALAARCLGVGWGITGLAGLGAAAVTETLGWAARSYTDERKFERFDSEHRLDRLQYAADPDPDKFALAGSLRQLSEATLNLDADQVRAFESIKAKLEKLSPRMSLGEAAWFAQLGAQEVRHLSEVWQARSRPLAELEVESIEDAIEVGDHQVEVR